ncbi:hypothetical protein Amet_1740 [Alkaliphilus metalliredigens QYMF]|uniref:Uncharacterized protein n=1 Tax=Alkaliphilus metalliredigens (strain QYMF) TaxID=293826 RepID=A6TNZ7_ALKMQ|nr:hypothetical protein [Alkaliphilus metalliredigens]ABR47915.1 hypothetical protein Amet_1740 [Alkaliphilus metalliredigens QYMF]
MNIEQMVIEELLEAWTTISYKLFNGGKEGKTELIQQRRKLINRLEAKGIMDIQIDGMGKDHYVLVYRYRSNKVRDKVFINL